MNNNDEDLSLQVDRLCGYFKYTQLGAAYTSQILTSVTCKINYLTAKLLFLYLFLVTNYIFDTFSPGTKFFSPFLTPGTRLFLTV